MLTSKIKVKNGRVLTKDLDVPKESEEREIPNIDANLEDADWIKMGWDLPPYKSKEFFKTVKDLKHFRTLPVYKHAVKSGVIKNDKWVGRKERERKRGDAWFEERKAASERRKTKTKAKDFFRPGKPMKRGTDIRKASSAKRDKN